MKNNPAVAVIKALLFIAGFIVILSLLSQLLHGLPSRDERFYYGVIGTVAAVLTTVIFLKIDKKRFADIGFKWERRTPGRFFFGLLIGLGISALLMIILVAITKVEFRLDNEFNVSGFLISTLPLIPLAFMEELAFRGYPFRTLQQSIGIRLTLIIIAVLFSLYHYIGGQSLGSSFLGPGIWSFAFGLAAIMSGGIAMPTGVHYGANLFLAMVGQKKEFESIWNIRYENELSYSEAKSIDTIGYVVHIIFFLLLVGLMEWWIRRRIKEKK